MTVAMEIDGVTAGYGEAMILRDVGLSVRAGEIFALLGKNGMGKSTLLKTVLGFLPARRGRIRIAGEDVTGLPTHLVARRSIAYAPQEQTLFQDLTVEENLRLGLPGDRGLREAVERVSTHFPIVGKRLSQKAGTLSGGEQKMLIVARALLRQPKLILIDEISEGLQPSMIERMAAVLKAESVRTGAAVLVVEQNVPFALSIADRFAVLKSGEIADRGETAAPGVEARIRDQLAV